MDALDPPVDREAFEAALIRSCEEKEDEGDEEEECESGLMLTMAEQSARIFEAMRYVVATGGKRVRAALCIAGYRYAVSLRRTEAIPVPGRAMMTAAVAVEMVHAASLVLDDLPCMDDADVRRSRPCVHLVHGEAISVLAASALVVRAVRTMLLSNVEGTRELLKAAERMAVGQTLDLELASREIANLTTVRRAHAGKTGALISASAVCGAICGGADAECVSRVRRFGVALGSAFQIADDVIDATRTSGEAGKPTGADAGKASSFVHAAGLEAARAEVRRLVDDAVAAVDVGDDNGDPGDLLRIARLVKSSPR